MSSDPNRDSSSRRHEGGAPLRGSANAFSPYANDVRCLNRKGRKTHFANYAYLQRLQDLRENSEQDSPSSQTQHGPIGAPARPSNTMSAYASLPLQPPPVHGGNAASALTLQASSAAVGPNVAFPPALNALLATGPITVFVEAERARPGASPHRPAFLNGVVVDPSNPGLWSQVVLPYVEGLTFNLATTTDLHFMGAMLHSPNHPQLPTAVTKLDLPGFYWFSGVGKTRPHNPYMAMAKQLPKLRQIVFQMHTASVTTSLFSEKEMIDIEKTGDLARSKQRKSMSLPKLVAHYEINALLACRALQRVRIEYVHSDMTAEHITLGDPIDVLRAVQTWLYQEFRRQGQAVDIDLVRVV